MSHSKTLDSDEPKKRICVFCGSSGAVAEKYLWLATQVGRELVARGFGVVYGGGRVGLMGAVADAALAAGGEVIGVIPRALVEREVAHASLSELIVVETMHERKAIMAERSDGFLALPGGFGTLEEMLEAITWNQLGIHAKPCVFLNFDGYYDALQTQVELGLREGFIPGAGELTWFERFLQPALQRVTQFSHKGAG